MMIVNFGHFAFHNIASYITITRYNRYAELGTEHTVHGTLYDPQRSLLNN